MSWTATIGADFYQNYTHNCNQMISTVLEENGAHIEKHWLIGHMGGSWFRLLNGMTGESGAKLLTLIIQGLELEPERFRAMNPGNGWGDYDRLVGVLKGMVIASLENPTSRWEVSG